MPEIDYILLDCDNTLVLSEELAFEACADLANEILEKYGFSDRYTGEQLIQDFVGQNFRGMMISLQSKYKFELPKEELEFYVKEEENQVIAKLKEKGRACEGCNQELEKLYESGKYRLAVVSSSALRRVQASIKKVGQDKYFNPDHVFSAATSLSKPTSKPDPAIYIHALDVLGCKPERAVAVEDSKSGCLSAIRAGIAVIAYVGCYADNKQDEVAARLTELGAKTVMSHWSQFQRCLKEIEAS